jgi:MFS transporter, PAT family, beta-lactamase induction signal transducer AmpG
MAGLAQENSTRISNTSVWARIFSKRMLICTVLGFSSGLPLYLLVNLVSAWLRDSNVDLKSIGLFSLVSVPYVWKFIWSPLLDRYNILRWGRRKSWMIVTQVALLFLIASIGFFSPSDNLKIIVVLCVGVALFSATQDIALDAYRREILEDSELGLGNSIFVNAYRVSGMIPGGLSLILSEYMSWNIVFIVTALFMLPGIIASIIIKEPDNCLVPRTLFASVVEPFKELLSRKKLLGVIGIVCFIFLYKFGDSMATALATPFYLDMGYSKSEIGIVNKSIGLWTMVIGGIVGGIWMLKIGINKALWIFGVGQIVTILGFVLIAHVWQNPEFVNNICLNISNLINVITNDNYLVVDNSFEFPNVPLLSFVVGAECLGAGLGTACFLAYMCRETNTAYVATQLALFTALAAIPRTVCNATTGYIIEAVGWENFFIICYALAIPGMLMLLWVAPFNKSDPS